MAEITQNIEVQESFKRFTAEIRNRTFAEAYLAVKDCIDQKEFCTRVGLNESRFSRVVRKVQELPTNKRLSKKTSSKTTSV